MRVSILATGSNGNATLVETNDYKFLIDDGISFKSFLERANECMCDIKELNSIFITHEHYDHVVGLKMLFKRIELDCYLTNGTYEGLSSDIKEVMNPSRVNIIRSNDIFIFGRTKITIIQLHHDAKEPIGFIVEENDKKLVYITDTGFVRQEYYPILKNADMYIIESNYDVELLWSSKRPFELKRRIDGDYGHMSNEASAVMMSKLIGPKTKKIVYAHISDDCNYYHMPEFIKNAHKKVYSECGVDYSNIDLYCGNRKGVTGVFEL
jgi:phosphoribosyl 1,2-cyclic phosphodiesterase